MYCNHCSVFTNKAHFETEQHKKDSNMLNEILLDIVGGEKGLVKRVLSYKKDLETETIKMTLNRFSFLERFTALKSMTLTNTFDNQIKISFSPRGYNKKPYECHIELSEQVSFNKLTKHQKQILETFDLSFVKLMGGRTGEKSNETMEKLLKEQIKRWNNIHLNIESEKLHFKEYENINFSAPNSSPVPILRLNQ